MRPRRPSNRPRYQLTALQFQAIQAAANAIAPDRRHSFLLRAHRALTVSSIGDCSDQLIARVIERALDEVAA